MSQYDRVLWEEGMFLGPQHFQQWDRQHNHALAARVRSVRAQDHGLTDLAVDMQALLGGEIALQRVAGVFQDGTSFTAPDIDPLPAPRRLQGAAGPGAAEVEVMLALPRIRLGSMVADADDARRGVTRYLRQELAVVDEIGGVVERAIPSGRLSLRLLFAGEPADEFETLPVARVQRTAAGTFALSPTFIPPCLYASASPVLLAILRRIYELLSSKRDELRGKRGQTVGGEAQVSAGGALSILLEHTIASHLPAVAHAFHQKQGHPADVFERLAGLAGALSTFAVTARTQSVPPYDHAAPTACFAAVLAEVEALPGSLAPDRAVAIALVASERDTWSGRIVDETLFDTADFYLGVRSDVGADRILGELPKRTKISSPEQVAQIRSVMVTGLKLTSATPPPAEIPQRPGMHYFRLQQDGRHWEAVRLARIITFFVPEDFTELGLECYAVRRPK